MIQNNGSQSRNYPMAYEAFQHAYMAKAQAEILNNPQTLNRSIEHDQQMQKIAYKSCLRVHEAMDKQLIKKVYNCIYQKDHSVILQKVNGLHVIVNEQVVFNGEIEKVKKYHREGAKAYEWQLIIETKDGKHIESALYSQEFLLSKIKLQKTILGRYLFVEGPDRKYIWDWLQNSLIEKIEKLDSIEIPYKAGWFVTEDKIHFWTGDDDPNLLSEEIKCFKIENFEEIDVETVLTSLRSASISKNTGAMFMIRLSALFERLVGDAPCGMKVVIVGESAETIAKQYLCVMQTKSDIVNLDFDRINYIRGKMKYIQDTPIIFISTDLDSKSSQNRMKEILGLIDSGYVEGEKITISAVFCLQNYTKSIPLNDVILLDASEISVSEKRVLFSMFQNLVISEIEKTGLFWIEDLRRNYNIYAITYRNEHKLMPLLYAIHQTLLKMFDVSMVGHKAHKELKTLMDDGIKYIKKQFSACENMLINIFREKIVNLVETDRLVVLNRYKATGSLNCLIIYYDEECYYFVNRTLDFVCKEAKINSKALLYIKQQLVFQELNKMYRTSINGRRDLEIDFRVTLKDNQKKDLSGFAIKRKFFDVLGGIALYERGGKNI